MSKVDMQLLVTIINGEGKFPIIIPDHNPQRRKKGNLNKLFLPYSPYIEIDPRSSHQ